MNFTIALAQIDARVGDLAANLQSHVAAIDQARQGGADLVVFPELSLSGYGLKDLASESVLRPGRSARVAEILALSKEISVLFGCAEESGEFGVHNSAFLAEDGELRCVHRKIYLPTYGMFEEMRHFSPGTELRCVPSRVGKLGVLICEDLWHLPLPYLLAKEGAGVLIGMAASPTRLSGDDARTRQAQVNTEQHRSYARLLSSYVVFCNRVGYEDGVNFWGGSEVIGPDGEGVVQAKLFEEQIVFAEILDDEIRRARRHARHFLDDDLAFTVRKGISILRQSSEPPAPEN
jgi:predicted amidohydrolase